MQNDLKCHQILHFRTSKLHADEQSKLLGEKENQKLQMWKKAAEHLQKLVSSGNEDEPAITTNNIHQQILQAERSKVRMMHPTLQQQNKPEENMEWMKNKLAMNP